MLIGYEMDAFNLDNHIQTAYKYLTRHEHYFDFEACMIKAFRQLLKTSDEAVEKKILEDLMLQLQALLDQKKVGRQQLSLQEILLWTKAKIGNTIIARVLNPKSVG